MPTLLQVLGTQRARSRQIPALAELAFQWENADGSLVSSSVNVVFRVSWLQEQRRGGTSMQTRRAAAARNSGHLSGSLFLMIQEMFIEHLLCANSVHSTEDVSEPGGKVSSLPASHRDRREIIRGLMNRGAGAVSTLKRALQGEEAEQTFRCPSVAWAPTGHKASLRQWDRKCHLRCPGTWGRSRAGAGAGAREDGELPGHPFSDTSP